MEGGGREGGREEGGREEGGREGGREGGGREGGRKTAADEQSEGPGFNTQLGSDFFFFGVSILSHKSSSIICDYLVLCLVV